MGLFAQELTSTQLFSFGIGSLLLYLVTGAIYRLYFSPLAKFPGPKLAALTLWYEFYFDVVLRGQFTFKVQELHKKYGTASFMFSYYVFIMEPSVCLSMFGSFST